MKKYWQTILITVIVVGTIGSYYFLQVAMASKNDISFKIETISGNKDEIKNLTLQTSYQSGVNHLWLYISKDGSAILNNRSLIGSLKNSNRYIILQKFIDQHRHFMRGKESNLSKYFEDKERLIYTNFQNSGQKEIGDNFLPLQIDILDKKTNDNSFFEIDTPVQASYDWININDVYVAHGKIKILATNYLYNGGEELHIYTVDENKKELENDAIIAKLASEERVNAIRVFNANDNIQNQDFYLYMVEKFGKHKEDGEREITSSQIYLYNNVANEQEEWIIPDELKPYRKSIVMHGANIFIPVYSANGLKLHRYTIEKKQWEEPFIINYESTANDNEIPFLQITDSKLYLVNHMTDGYALFINDLRTGESLYEGKIVNDKKENQDPDYSLYIEQVYSNY
ncbi:hypothetical protein [Lysinibacillus sp. ZYM-1]|uniref:hypothetical protein n=1 Tax=Lysinibacillus sp. ZYM-1 TaxID=1681184 RepID=UPI0006CE9A4A|nr:hypothetical protein [Lysinibacillus sp. ZYM-1]KPN89710.1 hypothetical protein AO843_08075 [Lysinibacillus sp. ZYM-1]